MLDTIFGGVLDTATQGLSIANFLMCLGAALITGIVIALFYMYKNDCSKSFAVTLAVLPSIVCVIIMMVSGSIGAGVAVAGTFSLVRFRSAPGSAREICAIFLAMATGIALGMGYIGYALLFALIISGASTVLVRTSFGEKRESALEKTLRITIPEDLDYAGVFDDLFREYTQEHRLTSVKTTNMGSLFKLSYDLTLKDLTAEKEFIDQLRCRNGNLEISSSIRDSRPNEL